MILMVLSEGNMHSNQSGTNLNRSVASLPRNNPIAHIDIPLDQKILSAFSLMDALSHYSESLANKTVTLSQGVHSLLASSFSLI